MVEDIQLVRVSEAIASAILERERVYPTFLERNPDNSFTANFADDPAPKVRQRILDADKTIVLVEPEMVEARQPNTEPGLAATVRFGFIQQPKVDLTD